MLILIGAWKLMKTVFQPSLSHVERVGQGQTKTEMQKIKGIVFSGRIPSGTR